MPTSHHRHGQDMTVLSSLVYIGGVNRTGNKSRLFSVVLIAFRDCTVSKFFVADSLDLLPNSVHTNHTTRQDSLVLRLFVFQSTLKAYDQPLPFNVTECGLFQLVNKTLRHMLSIFSLYYFVKIVISMLRSFLAWNI